MNRAIQKTRNTIAFIRGHGVLSFLRELRYRVTNHYYERSLGVETAGTVKIEDLGFANSEFVDYAPIGYREIYSALERIPLEKSMSTFLDYGSGKGRAIIVAATLPFRRVIGIEISDRLLAIAEKNLNTMRHKRCKCVELFHMNATRYAVPGDVNLIYFFNPFGGRVVQKVVDNIYNSYKQTPREIYIIFFNNDLFESAVKNQNWITRTEQTRFDKFRCGIYVTKAPGKR